MKFTVVVAVSGLSLDAEDGLLVAAEDEIDSRVDELLKDSENRVADALACAASALLKMESLELLGRIKYNDGLDKWRKTAKQLMDEFTEKRPTSSTPSRPATPPTPGTPI